MRVFEGLFHDLLNAHAESCYINNNRAKFHGATKEVILDCLSQAYNHENMRSYHDVFELLTERRNRARFELMTEYLKLVVPNPTPEVCEHFVDCCDTNSPISSREKVQDILDTYPKESRE